MSISCAKEISARASARLPRSPSIERVSEMSTFTMSGAICKVCRKLAYPAPASSIAIRTPSARSGASHRASSS
jgi:hypothetical protein